MWGGGELPYSTFQAPDTMTQHICEHEPGNMDLIIMNSISQKAVAELIYQASSSMLSFNIIVNFDLEK